MSDPRTRVDELVRHFSRPGSSAADLLCDSHPADAVAFTVIEPDLGSRDLTYGELRTESTKFAAALAGLGVGPGDAVAVLMGKSAELVVALLGIWRRGAIHVPLFTAFAPPAIELRVGASGAKVVVTDADQRAKLDQLVGDPGQGPRLVVVGGPAGGHDDFHELLARHGGDEVEPAALGPDGVLIELFTSGTTGAPKAVQVPVHALAGILGYLELGLDLRADDVYWNAADPGWAYGLYYAVLGPLAAGRRSLLLHAPFAPATTWRVLDRFRVTNFAAAPTVYRSLRGQPVPPGLELRCLSSAGEPLTPDVPAWAESALGVTVRDHYGQTEQGMMIGNGWAGEIREPVRPGSMGRPFPGWSVAILADDSTTPAPAGTVGQVAVDVPNSPLASFRGYARATGSSRFSDDGRWYLTGDTATQDEDGFFHFSARDDDVILMAGYRIGPFEVETVLLSHPAVAEAAAVGRPDPLRGEVLEAHVVLTPGAEGTLELERELQQLVKDNYAKHAYPRTVHFTDALPKTPSGKIQRFLLRQGAPGSRSVSS
ncbi:AMP-binding protein [Pseudonocardia sp. C8]|uniref:AMP-binding protein n=1 Tax=Pseudonocardia sp. C8 TaxID=2762759 RepID=UPI0016427252|nr:AMP-binding protein [Pseudonocardia sp. C8]MBC3191036.1 AMP-binding protein [Pseudonocardia sp. C8]